jgi:hypothetical protein
MGWTRSKFGPEILAYSVYQNIGLRLPQESVDRSLNKLFGVHLRIGTTNRFKAKAAETYKGTYDALIKRLCNGQLIHADETKISVEGKDGFVWVFANMEEVAYVYSETRQGSTPQSLLKDFTGVLVSDFYAAYDGIPCPQQKCLIHLIRDLNDAVLKYPYDEELKRLVKSFAELVKPMVETVDRHGLKSHFLRKHLVSVDRFYRRLSGTDLQSESAGTFKERFEKNRDKLFTFLVHDGVPWNNNNAEHAVKAFAMLRHTIGGSLQKRAFVTTWFCLAYARHANTRKWTFWTSCGRARKMLKLLLTRSAEDREIKEIWEGSRGHSEYLALTDQKTKVRNHQRGRLLLRPFLHEIPEAARIGDRQITNLFRHVQQVFVARDEHIGLGS